MTLLGFLSTQKRHQLLANGPILSVPVLYSGIAPQRLSDLLALVIYALVKTDEWKSYFEKNYTRKI